MITLQLHALRFLMPGHHGSRVDQDQDLLHDLEPGSYAGAFAPATREQASAALATYDDILRHLSDAYRRGDMEDAANIVKARQCIMLLDAQAEQLALSGLGVPFF